jgi:hypothetical protein
MYWGDTPGGVDNGVVLAWANDTNWHQFVGTVGTGLTSPTLYMDGLPVGSPTGAFPTSDAYRIACAGGPAVTLDEIRILKVALDSDTVLAEYRNQSSPSTFYTIGVEIT